MTTAHEESDWKILINGGEEHPVPHAHIIFRDGSRVSVALDSLEILAYRDELLVEYRRLNQ